MPTDVLAHTTPQNIAVLVRPGSKSQFDFQVRYREPGRRIRTPKHIHLIIDLFMKRVGNVDLTNRLVDYIIDSLITPAISATSFPPVLRQFNAATVAQFSRLDAFGEYSAEFLLAVAELVMIQEKTNYPNGTMNLRLFQAFRSGQGIFEVVSAATFSGRGRRT